MAGGVFKTRLKLPENDRANGENVNIGTDTFLEPTSERCARHGSEESEESGAAEHRAPQGTL
jgi:hypothetical protein